MLFPLFWRFGTTLAVNHLLLVVLAHQLIHEEDCVDNIFHVGEPGLCGSQRLAVEHMETAGYCDIIFF